MGLNTTVIVLNDALGHIENDPEFGKKLAHAIREAYVLSPTDLRRRHAANVRAGSYVNAATVIETHHSSMTVLVAIGGNYGTELHRTTGGRHHELPEQWRILEEAYDASTHKKPTKGVSSS